MANSPLKTNNLVRIDSTYGNHVATFNGDDYTELVLLHTPYNSAQSKIWESITVPMAEVRSKQSLTFRTYAGTVDSSHQTDITVTNTTVTISAPASHVPAVIVYGR